MKDILVGGFIVVALGFIIVKAWTQVINLYAQKHAKDGADTGHPLNTLVYIAIGVSILSLGVLYFVDRHSHIQNV